MSEQIKKSFKKLREDLPSPDQAKKMALIEQSKQLILHVPTKRASLPQFYLQQLRFIRRRTWVIQFLIVLIAAYVVINAPNIQEVIALASAVSPLIFLVSYSEWIRSQTHQVYELELTTAFSYKSVMLARIGLMNMLNMLAITVLIFTVVQTGQLAILQAFFFVCIPFLLTSIVGIWIVRNVQTKHANQAVYAGGSLFSASLILIITLYPKLFLTISNGIWWSILLVTMGMVVYQYNQLMRQMSVQTEQLQV